jgi:hypothetical protein
MGRITGRFGRVEPRRRARAFVLGLLSELPRKNCRTLAVRTSGQGSGGQSDRLRLHPDAYGGGLADRLHRFDGVG